MSSSRVLIVMITRSAHGAHHEGDPSIYHCYQTQITGLLVLRIDMIDVDTRSLGDSFLEHSFSDTELEAFVVRRDLKYLFSSPPDENCRMTCVLG